MKYCYKCKQNLPKDDFWKDSWRKDGLNNKCKKCHNKAVNEHRSKNPELRSERSKAYSNLYYAIKTGKIKKRNICEICYDFPTECHHEDYSKQLEFVELCSSCHSKLHAQKPATI